MQQQQDHALAHAMHVLQQTTPREHCLASAASSPQLTCTVPRAFSKRTAARWGSRSSWGSTRVLYSGLAWRTSYMQAVAERKRSY